MDVNVFFGHHDTQHNDIQHNDTQDNIKVMATLNVIMLNVIDADCYK